MSSFSNTLKNIAPQMVAALTALFCAFLLAFAFVLEYFVELAPCPLCIAQRLFFILIGFVAVGFLWGVIARKTAGVKIIILSLLGGGIAFRQVWMQWYPGNIDPTRCGISFGSYIDQFLEALGGTGSCAKVDWTLIGLSIAEWSLLCFIFLLLVGIWFLCFLPQSNREAV
jgi:disulfide bond formation protein DsbB